MRDLRSGRDRTGGTILAKIKIDGRLFDTVHFSSKQRTACSEGFYETRDMVKPYCFTDILTRFDGITEVTQLGVIKIEMYKVKCKSYRDHVASQPAPGSEVSRLYHGYHVEEAT